LKIIDMTGLGFSPSDIVEFGKFADKIRVALKEDGGSKTDNVEAIGWCDGFSSVSGEIRGLQLSNVP
jgi:hypothetical protein